MWAAASEEDGAWRGGRGGGEAGWAVLFLVGRGYAATPATNIRSDAGDQHPERRRGPTPRAMYCSSVCLFPSLLRSRRRCTAPPCDSSQRFCVPATAATRSILISLFSVSSLQMAVEVHRRSWCLEERHLPLFAYPLSSSPVYCTISEGIGSTRKDAQCQAAEIFKKSGQRR